jgi:hypothetical protein
MKLFTDIKTNSRCNSVGTATGYGVGRPGFDSRQGLDFSPLHVVQTGSEAHPAS